MHNDALKVRELICGCATDCEREPGVAGEADGHALVHVLSGTVSITMMHVYIYTCVYIYIYIYI